jgi:hypothetical protein
VHGVQLQGTDAVSIGPAGDLIAFAKPSLGLAVIASRALGRALAAWPVAPSGLTAANITNLTELAIVLGCVSLLT